MDHNAVQMMMEMESLTHEDAFPTDTDNDGTGDMLTQMMTVWCH